MENPTNSAPIVPNTPAFLPKERGHIWPLLQMYARGIAGTHLDVKEIRVFGDFLNGGARFNGFIDLLIILDHCEIPFRDRSLHYLGNGFRFGVALYPLTREEIDREIRKGNTDLQRAVTTSRRIYPF